MWRKIKPYLIGALTAIGAVIAFILGRSTGMGRGDDGGGSEDSARRIRDTIGDHNERARNIELAEQRLERMEREAQRTTEQRDELERRTDSGQESGRRTVNENRDFIERLRGRSPD